MLAKYGKLFLTKLRTDRTSSHTIKVCIVGTNCICTYALNICVCTRGIVYELFHTHLTKHHIICDRLSQLIIHFARKVSHITSDGGGDEYILPCHLTQTSICTASACCLYLERYQISFNHLVSFVILVLYVYLIFMCIIVWFTCQYHVSCHHQRHSHFLSFVTINLFDTSIKILY